MKCFDQQKQGIQNQLGRYLQIDCNVVCDVLITIVLCCLIPILNILKPTLFFPLLLENFKLSWKSDSSTCNLFIH